MKLRIAYVVNHVAFFVSHRLPLAAEALENGYDVSLFTGKAGSPEMEAAAMAELNTHCIKHRRCIFSSSGMQPIGELIGVLQLIWFVYRFKPDLLHCASPKAVLYGGVAARLCRVPGLVLAISGFGYAFTKGSKPSLLRRFIRLIYQGMSGFVFSHPNIRVIVQNQDDHKDLLAKKMISPEKLVLIKGSGVDLAKFKSCDPLEKQDLIILPARMLKDKGVEEFVAAAKFVKKKAPQWRLVLAGAAGYDNPSAIMKAQLRAWDDDGDVEYLGHIEDMLPLLLKAAIVCLPSYREGMPKALLEAAAAGCAVVTTDVTGCREAILPGITGDLVPARDPQKLSQALLLLIENRAKRGAYGAAGQVLAAEHFSIDSVVAKTMAIYEELLEYG